MKYYPILLSLKDKSCVVIGGGKVAERKVISLLRSGTRVLVISPELSPTLKALAEKKRITHYPRTYKRGDLKGSFMAFSVTNSRETNDKVVREAKGEGILINVVDTPEQCDFIVPAVVTRGNLLIAISTIGKSPALASEIRNELEERFGWEYGAFLNLMGAIRVRLLTKGLSSSYNKNLFLKLVSSPLLKLIREGKDKEVDKILKEILDEGFTLSKLKVSITPNR